MKMNIIDSVKNTAFSAAVHTALEYLEKNPEENIPKAMRLMDQVLPDGLYCSVGYIIRSNVGVNLHCTGCWAA